MAVLDTHGEHVGNVEHEIPVVDFGVAEYLLYILFGRVAQFASDGLFQMGSEFCDLLGTHSSTFGGSLVDIHVKIIEVFDGVDDSG